jgi:hypothetical protein
MTDDENPDRNADRIRTHIKLMLERLKARFRQAGDAQGSSVKAQTDRGQNDA